MHRTFRLVLVATSSLVLWACAGEHNSTARPKTASTVKPAGEVMDDQYEAPPPRTTVPAVMQAKLAHAQAILEGIALADYAQVETNAQALKRISQGADWLAHESAAYFDFSAAFRDTCDDLVHNAALKNVRAMVENYGSLTNTCVACHEYLRKERQSKDMPGRVSMAPISGSPNK